VTPFPRSNLFMRGMLELPVSLFEDVGKLELTLLVFRLSKCHSELTLLHFFILVKQAT